MKVLFTTVLLFLLSFSSDAHFTNEFLWQSNSELLASFVSFENSTNNIENVEFSSVTELENRNDLKRDTDQNRVFRKFLNRFSQILNIQKHIQDSFSKTDEDLPSADLGYQRLKQIDFSGQLSVFKPKKLNYATVMMAMSEFEIFQSSDNEITISLDFLSDQKINIFDSNLKLVASVFVSSVEKTFVEVDISNFAVGSYTASDGRTTVEFEKE